MNNTAQLQQPQIERGTITVANIYPAKGPGKSAWLKDSDGVMFGFRPEKLGGVLNVGGTFEIEFTAKESGGNTYRDIRSARMVAATEPPARTEPARTATPNGNSGSQYYRPTAPRDSERMFVCSTLNAFIQTGRIDAHRDHLTAVIAELRAAYAATFGKDDPS